MRFTVVTDLDKCKLLWKKFSPKETMWELWEVASSFIEPGDKPHFVVAIDDSGNECGLLPLCESNGRFVFLGDSYIENMKFWFDKSLIGGFLKQLPLRTELSYLNNECAASITSNGSTRVVLSDYRYLLNLEKINFDLSGYLKSFNRDHRKHFLKEVRLAEDYQMVWEGVEHFDDLVRLSVARFGAESDFADPLFVSQIKSLFSALAKEGLLYALTIMKDNKVVGIKFGAYYKNHYYIINGSYDRSLSNIGKILTWEHMKKAAELHALDIDFMAGNYGWKELWNLEKEPYYDVVFDNLNKHVDDKEYLLKLAKV